MGRSIAKWRFATQIIDGLLAVADKFQTYRRPGFSKGTLKKKRVGRVIFGDQNHSRIWHDFLLIVIVKSPARDATHVICPPARQPLSGALPLPPPAFVLVPPHPLQLP